MTPIIQTYIKMLQDFPPEDLKSAANVREIIPKLKTEIADNLILIALVSDKPNGSYYVGLLRDINSQVETAIEIAENKLKENKCTH